MRPLPSSLLAQIIRPPASFLAPRFLCGPARVAALAPSCRAASGGLQRPTYSTRATKKSPKENRARHKIKRSKSDAGKQSEPPSRKAFSDGLSLLKQFHEACMLCHVGTIVDLYPSIIKSELAGRETTRKLAQALHTASRTLDRTRPEYQLILPFLGRVDADLRSGKLPPHPAAHVHLLGIYKETKMYEKGNNLWQWLAGQEDSFVSQAVYGAAIELLAYRGQDDLEALERLYWDSLKRFPGHFAKYHLSPEAIVPDRTQATTIPRLPISLLQGITTARLLNRDWKNAYLAFDTALRLYPASLPTRFFELFITERPLTEAYTVFLLACRSGIVLRPGRLTNLLRSLQNATISELSSQKERFAVIQAMANAIFAYVQAGGHIEGPHMGLFFSSLKHLLPKYGHGSAIAEDEMKMRNVIITFAYDMTISLVQAGMPRHPQLFTSLLTLAARLQVPELLGVVRQDIEKYQVVPSDVLCRCVIQVAGELRDNSLIEDFWSQIVMQAESSGEQISEHSWLTLAKSCQLADYREYFHHQVEFLKHAIDAETEQKAMTRLHLEEHVQEGRELTLLDSKEFSLEMEKVTKILKNIIAVTMAGQPLDIRKSPFSMFLDPSREPIASNEDLECVYNDLSTDPNQPSLPPGQIQEVAVSSTGLAFHELRFMNWVTVLELMLEAEAAEMEFQHRLEEAIANGVPLDKTLPILPTFLKSKKSIPGEATPLRTVSRISLQNTVRRLRDISAPKDRYLITTPTTEYKPRPLIRKLSGHYIHEQRK